LLVLCRYCARRDLPPSPTRRSSDLLAGDQRLVGRQPAGDRARSAHRPAMEQADGVLAANGVAHLQQRRVRVDLAAGGDAHDLSADRKSTRLNSSHVKISYAVFCLKK